MINVCYQCGLYHADKVIDPAGPFAVCPECGYKHPFRQLPLLVVSGASGAGKSSVCQHLLRRVTQAVPLDIDILWRPEFNTPETGYRDFLETWLRMCKNISQSGRPVVLFGAGVGVPENLENCVERRYFSQIYYLALVCSEEILTERLRQRPAWRATHEQAYIDESIRFNNWFKTNYSTSNLIDTTNISIEESTQQTSAWIDRAISNTN